ncbi:IucA/IucC family protein [Paenibacillus sp. GCM10027627]|uniref:IucA/IucC family protein n=1 Tax=unclassified Paenibacillus TaxID=185978 RepID=UPI0036312AFA
MLDAKRLAEEASIQSFLNCYLRETGPHEIASPATSNVPYALTLAVPAEKYFKCKLANVDMTLYAGIRYLSMTGRHKFIFPIMMQSGSDGALYEADYLYLVTTIAKELSLDAHPHPNYDDLVLRVIQSCQHIERFIAGRQGDEDALYGEEMSFLESEQSLLLGHLIHPAPKSRQGIAEEETALYSPELKGSFQLHYFRAHKSIMREDCALPGQTATAWVKEELAGDSAADAGFVADYCGEDDYSLIPLHPLQARHVISQPTIQKLIENGLLYDLGPAGRAYSATSSLRTLYHPDSSFMVKGSIPVKITNSLRVNKYKELERGVEVKRLMDTEIGERLREAFPSFHILCDPAFLTVQLEGEEESGFETILRDNPFRGEDALNANVVAALSQDSVYGEVTRIESVVRALAEREGITVQEASLKWFRSYLAVSLEPMVWLYLQYGIALEAHQQNSVIQLKDGYPSVFYYRDNQGYYFCQSTFERLNQLLPGVSSASQTVCDDHVADERFRYYLIFNHMFGVINGFGAAGLIEENALLAELRACLAKYAPVNREPSEFLPSLLNEKALPCKANLLTRLHDMDELVGAMESQSVYVPVRNPLLQAGRVSHV